MRIIVMSDSHTAFSRVRRIVEKNKDADIFIHLGDGEDEFEDVHLLYPQLKFLSVKGNNDFRSFSKKEGILEVGGQRIFYTHGDMYNVKWSFGELMRAAKENKASIVLYGHTHAARIDFIDDIYLINPGSVADSRITKAGYLALDITENGTVPVLRTIDPQPDEY